MKRKKEEDMDRVFCGVHDKNAVILTGAFPNSPVVVSTGIYLRQKRNGIALQGPVQHLDFLFPFLGRLLSLPARTDTGKWSGLYWLDDESGWLSILYDYGKDFADRFELLESKLRRDIARVAKIKLAEPANIYVVSEGEVVFSQEVGLPEGLEENGTIEIPEISRIVKAKTLIEQ